MPFSAEPLAPRTCVLSTGDCAYAFQWRECWISANELFQRITHTFFYLFCPLSTWVVLKKFPFHKLKWYGPFHSVPFRSIIPYAASSSAKLRAEPHSLVSSMWELSAVSAVSVPSSHADLRSTAVIANNCVLFLSNRIEGNVSQLQRNGTAVLF